jgi:putative transposase
LGYRTVWCPRYGRPALAAAAGGRCEDLRRAEAGGHGWRVAALEFMPRRVSLFMKAHRSRSPSRVVGQFAGFTSRRLRGGFVHLCSRLLTLWSWWYLVARADAVSAGRVRRYFSAQGGRRRKERAR